jgi:tetratricopeptide (TPR) repeat protein
MRYFAFGLLIIVSVFGYQRIISDIYLFEATHYVGKRDWPKALASSTGAYRSNPYGKESSHIMGMAAIYTGDTANGVKRLEEYARSNPYDLIPLINLGIVYHLTGRNEEAIQIRNRVLAISPEYAKMIK